MQTSAAITIFNRLMLSISFPVHKISVLLLILIITQVPISATAGEECNQNTLLFLKETIGEKPEKRWNGEISYRVVGLTQEDRNKFINESKQFNCLEGIKLKYVGDTFGNSRIIFIFEYTDKSSFRALAAKLFTDVNEIDILNRIHISDGQWVVLNKEYNNKNKHSSLASICLINKKKLTASISNHVWFRVFFDPNFKSNIVRPSFFNDNGSDFEIIQEFDMNLLKCFYSKVPPDHVLNQKTMQSICECLSY